MFAIIAAVIFALELLLEIIGGHLGSITFTELTTAGLLCIALGWDRVCMLLAGETSIREVIAFPKTRGGFDPLTSAPTPITAQQRTEAGIDAKPKPPSTPGA